MGRQALCRTPTLEVQHISNSHLDTKIHSNSDHHPYAGLQLLGYIYVYACESPVGTQHRWLLRESAIIHDLGVRPELNLSGDRHYHGSHAGVHLAGSKYRYANEVLRCFDNGARICVSHSKSMYVDVKGI